MQGNREKKAHLLNLTKLLSNQQKKKIAHRKMRLCEVFLLQKVSQKVLKVFTLQVFAKL
jgi:hypothetical protein